MFHPLRGAIGVVTSPTMDPISLRPSHPNLCFTSQATHLKVQKYTNHKRLKQDNLPPFQSILYAIMFGLGCASAVPLFFVEVTADSEHSKDPSHQLDLLKILEPCSDNHNLHHDRSSGEHGGKYDAMSGIVPLPGTKTPPITTV